MKASVMRIVVIFVALLASACSSEQQATDPASVIQDYYDKLNAGDLDGALAYVPEDAILFLRGVHSGKGQITEFLRLEIGHNTRYELSDIEVDGSEVVYGLTIRSDEGIFRFGEFILDAVVEDGMLISNRIRVEAKNPKAAA